MARGVTENDLDLENPNFKNNMMEEFEIEKKEIKQYPKKLNKKIIKGLENAAFPLPSERSGSTVTKGEEENKDDAYRKFESDLLMKEWIAEFTAEIDEIDNFYTTKFNQYAKEFIDM